MLHRCTQLSFTCQRTLHLLLITSSMSLFWNLEVHCIIICQWLKTWGADWTLYLFHHCVVYFWSEAFILEESNHMCPEEVISSPIVKGHGKRQTLSCVRTPLGNISLVWDVRSLMGWDVAAGQLSTYIYRFENYFLHSKDKSMHTTFPLWHIALSFCVKRQVKKKKKIRLYLSALYNPETLEDRRCSQ